MYLSDLIMFEVCVVLVLDRGGPGRIVVVLVVGACARGVVWVGNPSQPAATSATSSVAHTPPHMPSTPADSQHTLLSCPVCCRVLYAV